MPDHRRRSARRELRAGARPAEPRAPHHRSRDAGAGAAGADPGRRCGGLHVLQSGLAPGRRRHRRLPPEGPRASPGHLLRQGGRNRRAGVARLGALDPRLAPARCARRGVEARAGADPALRRACDGRRPFDRRRRLRALRRRVRARGGRAPAAERAPARGGDRRRARLDAFLARSGAPARGRHLGTRLSAAVVLRYIRRREPARGRRAAPEAVAGEERPAHRGDALRRARSAACAGARRLPAERQRVQRPEEHPAQRGALRMKLLPFLLGFALTSACAQDVQPIKDAGPYVPSPQSVVSDMLRYADVSADDFLIDLGSGDGRIVLTAAKVFGARGFGVEIKDELVKKSNEAAQKEGLADRVKFLKQDLFKTDMSQATVIMLKDKFLSELKPGTRIVSHDYPLTGWIPEKYVQMDLEDKVQISGVTTTLIYLYIVPAKVAGSWKVQMPPAMSKQPATLSLRQQLTRVTGSVRLDGKEVLLE